MSAITYVVINFSEARKKKLPGYEGPPQVWEDDYGWGLWRCVDGKPVEEVGADGGEPEDQLLVRGWKWVGEELNRLAGERNVMLGILLRMDEALSNACDPVQGSNNPLEALRFDIRDAITVATGGDAP